MATKQQVMELKLSSKDRGQGEAPELCKQSVEEVMVKDARESLGVETLLEEVLEKRNIYQAMHRVIVNKGAPGIDGMTVKELPEFMRNNWEQIKEQLLSESYLPKAVRRVEIAKPDGGVRKLGIPTVLDRLIQQALLQVLQPKYDRTFSPNSYGFRPRRSTHQAVEHAQRYIKEGYAWVVDLDLERFFDCVNHDRLMARMAKDIRDKRVLRLIRKYLQSGIMEDGLVSPSREGAPQGGPLSPLLSNIVLDELDVELTKRGHRYVRYADDQNIYVKSETVGKRVLSSVTKFITEKLKLRVNESKSAVDRPWNRKFLGFSFTTRKRCKVAPKAIERFKGKVKRITRRTGGKSFMQVISQLKLFLNGWREYFGFAEVRSDLQDLDSWVRRKLRCLLWKQWQYSGKRYRELCKRGVRKYTAWVTAKSGKGPWRMSESPAMQQVLSNHIFLRLGLPSIDIVTPRT